MNRTNVLSGIVTFVAGLAVGLLTAAWPTKPSEAPVVQEMPHAFTIVHAPKLAAWFDGTTEPDWSGTPHTVYRFRDRDARERAVHAVNKALGDVATEPSAHAD